MFGSCQQIKGLRSYLRRFPVPTMGQIRCWDGTSSLPHDGFNNNKRTIYTKKGSRTGVYLHTIYTKKASRTGVYLQSSLVDIMRGYFFINKDAPITSMNTNTKTTMAILAIAAISLTVMANIDAIAFVNTAVAQNMTANATDTSNMTTFEENTTLAGNASSSSGIT